MSRARVSTVLAFAVFVLAALSATAHAYPHTLGAIHRMDEAQDVNCTVSMLPIQFGSVTPTRRTVPIVVTATCPAGTPYELRFLSPAGCSAIRSVGNVQVALQLPGGAPWCDGTNGTLTLQATGTGAPQTFYGTAEVLGNVTTVRAGAYQEPLQLELVPQPVPQQQP